MDTKPFYVGVEWTNEIDNQEILEKLDRISCMELIPENFFDGRRPEFLAKLKAAGIPVLVHSVEVSFGTNEPIKEEHLARVLEVAERVETANVSDHLSMTEAGGVEIGQLTPVPWTIECADNICRNIEAIQRKLDVPFLIENITNRFLIPDTELTEVQFINRILERSGCGLLLDLNNIHTNATNFGFDPFEWIDQIHLKHMQAIHLAGGYVDEDGVLIDSHDSAVPPRVWELYEYVCSRKIPLYTIVERTANPPAYEELLAESERAEAIVTAAWQSQHSYAKAGAL